VYQWMAFKRKYRSNPYKKSRRGKYSRKTRKGATFQTRVNRVLLKKAETKYFDRGVEHNQLYHNTGFGAGIGPTFPVASIPNFFNPWINIVQGTGRQNRIGDKITPRGMRLKMYIANKADRPNTMVRIIVAVLPKVLNGSIVGCQFDPFQGANSGLCGNNMLLPADTDKGVKFLYDKIHHMTGSQRVTDNPAAKEQTKVIKLWIKSRRGTPIVYDTTSTDIVNKPIAVYAIPYEQFSTLTSDNIASVACFQRLYFKDV